MDVSLSETQRLLRESIREYLEREVPFSRIRQVEASSGMDAALLTALTRLGWMGLAFAPEYGGQGGELTDVGVLIEELTRRAVLVPIVETLAAGITIQRHGDADLARAVLPQIIEGKVTVSPAVQIGRAHV